MPVMKRSRQRDAILTYLNTRTDHPTADMVFTALQKTMPNISLGTVYRNLSQLADRGTILRISCNGTADHFDAMTQPHPHFFCDCCGCVQDLPGSLPFEPSSMVFPEFKGRISGCSIMYYGTCEACLQNGLTESNSKPTKDAI
ncbi:MAG: transcriptional repressor [Lachnospiraceae bacterium]|nr:transcriptional repressor [Lachnospiraceae bacterium]